MRLSFFCFLLLLSFFSIGEAHSQISKVSKRPPIVVKRTVADLNGDNKKEYIVFCCYGLYDVKDYNRFVLEINQNMIIHRAENLDGSFAIVDIDTTDKFKEIAIPESGPSEDYATYFFCFRDDSIISMGRLPGTYVLKIDGSGIIQTKKRGKILQTWFFPAKYKLDDKHRLHFIEQEIYMMNQKVSMKDTLDLQKSPDDPQVITTLYPNDKAIIIGSDDKKWCLVETENGIRGWFAVGKFDRIVGTNKRAPEIFDGLRLAD